MVFAYPCFSGECGFCAECCERCFNKDEGSGSPEILKRAEDLSKFLGKKRVDAIMMDYNSQLKSWCKDNGYRNPKDPGSSKKTVMIAGPGMKVFKLIQGSHGAVCDDARCKVGYVNSSDWIHSSTYTNLPVYERVGDHNGVFHLCGPCLSRKPTQPDISSL